MNALIENNIAVSKLNEYAEEMGNSPGAKQLNELPLSYILLGKMVSRE